jgi:hypothetical protein
MVGVGFGGIVTGRILPQPVLVFPVGRTTQIDRRATVPMMMPAAVLVPGVLHHVLYVFGTRMLMHEFHSFFFLEARAHDWANPTIPRIPVC